MSAIFWINLDARSDRRVFMERQFATLGLSARRISAVSPAQLGDVIPGDGALSASEACVTESHRQSWRAIAECGAPFALVLEDDAVLSSLLPAFLENAAPLMAQWELVRIETGPRRVKLSRPLTQAGPVALHQAYSDQWGTAGYLISAGCAARLVEEPQIFARPLDRCLFDPRGPLFARISWRQCAPGLCIQGDQLHAGDALWHSDVSTERADLRVRNRIKLSASDKMAREAGRIGRQLRGALVDAADLAARGIAWRRIEYASGDEA